MIQTDALPSGCGRRERRRGGYRLRPRAKEQAGGRRAEGCDAVQVRLRWTAGENDARKLAAGHSEPANGRPKAGSRRVAVPSVVTAVSG